MNDLTTPMVIVTLGALLLPALWLLRTYNRLISLRNLIREAWADVDTELERRHDLVPNLVATVKGYVAHERGTIDAVLKLRALCLSLVADPVRQGQAEGRLGDAVRRLLLVVESYPDLKADQQFLNLQRELSITEDRIQAARRFYNGNVREYRILCESVPSSVIARAFGFQPEAYFGADDEARGEPPVSFADAARTPRPADEGVPADPAIGDAEVGQTGPPG